MLNPFTLPQNLRHISKGLGLMAVALIGFSACTDEVDIDSSFQNAQPVIDAWLSDKSEPQTIYLTLTQDYYSNLLPPTIRGAEVMVCQINASNTCFTFIDQGDGRYVWTPGFGESLGPIGTEFELEVVLPSGKTAIASTALYRTAPIDSISFRFEEEQLGLDSGTYAQVYARDLTGPGDRYWIRTTINDTSLNRISDLNLAFDAAFDGGTTTDGIYFIFPIRVAINKRDEDGGSVPLERGDTVHVEIWSLAPEAFSFLREASIQIRNGDSQLFSLPTVNVRGNVTEATSGERILGMFSVSAVSQRGRRFE